MRSLCLLIIPLLMSLLLASVQPISPSFGVQTLNQTLAPSSNTPLVKITTVSPNPASTGETVTVAYSVISTSSIAGLNVTWGDGITDNPGNTSSSDSHIYQITNYQLSYNFTITVTASNSTGSGSASATVKVTDRPPELDITSQSNPTTPGQLVALNFTASDPDGTVVTTWVDWGDSSTPELIMTMNSASMCQKFNPSLNSNACTIPPGDLIFAKPQDPSTISDGTIIVFRWPTGSNFIVVHRVVQVYTPTNNTSNPGQYAFITHGDANSPGANEGPIPAASILGIYKYTLTPDTQTAGGRYDTHTYPNIAGTYPKSYTITVNATDDSGSKAQVTSTETVVLPPTVTIYSVSPSQIPAGDTVTLSFSAADIDATVSYIEISWGDNTSGDILLGNATSQTHIYSRPGTFTISITATDNYTFTSQTQTSNVTVIPAPVLSIPTPTIFGLDPTLFYVTVGIILVGVAAGTALAVRAPKKSSRRKTR